MRDWGLGVSGGRAPGERKESRRHRGALAASPWKVVALGPRTRPGPPPRSATRSRAPLGRPVSRRRRAASLGLCLCLSCCGCTSRRTSFPEVYLPLPPAISVYLGVFSPKITCAPVFPGPPSGADPGRRVTSRMHVCLCEGTGSLVWVSVLVSWLQSVRRPWVASGWVSGCICR